MSDKAVRLERKLIKVENDSAILTEGIVRIEQEKSEIRKKVVDLERERLYINLTRDKKGVLHSIKPSAKHAKVIKDISQITADGIVEKFLGRKIDTKEIGIGKICGLSAMKSNILIGFADSKGWRSSSEGSII